MAKKHRMLFPVLSETNQMLDCSTGVCDTACPYNCYPYPDYYTISPRPPPLSPFPPLPSPSPSPSSPSIPAVYQESPNSSSNSSSDAVIIITVASAVLFVLLTGFVVAAKFASNRLHRVTHEEDQSDSEDSEQIFNGEQVDHPIWFIRTTGLQQSIINSITICRYKRGDGLIERTDCPICLNEFEEHESLRLLPKCNHAFHISCIDTWLRSHTNCPLCRASVVSSEGSRSSAPADASLGGSGSWRENDRDGDGGVSRGSDQSENIADPGRSRDETAFKDPTSSSYLDYLNTDPNSNAQMDCSCLSHASHQNLQERPGDESKNLDEPEREERIRVYKESSNRSLGSSINSISITVIKMENPEFPGKSCQEKDQES